MALAKWLPTEHRPWVEDWKIEVPDSPITSTTSRLTRECVAVSRLLLKRMRTRAEIPHTTFRAYEKSQSSLSLWDAGYGVGEGKLDDLLARSRTLCRSTLSPLVSISAILTKKLMPLVDPDNKKPIAHRTLDDVTAEAKTSLHVDFDGSSDSEDSGSDSPTSPTDASNDWDEILEDLSTEVECLLALDPIIRCPAPDISRKRRGDKGKDKMAVDWQPHLSYSDKISNRFPDAPLNLVDRLARANWERFLRTKAAREEAAVPAEEPQETTDGAFVTVAFAAGQSLEHAMTEPASSKFHDSGVGTSVRTGSAYAETIMSYQASGRESVRIPPLPEGAKQGKPFDCVACGRQLAISNNSAWKRHLYLDLCPWICHDVNCGFGNKLFSNRNEWLQHLALGHGLAPEWASFKCPLCFHKTGDGKLTISAHLSNHMEEISLAALPVGAEDEDGEHSMGSELGSETDESHTTDVDGRRRGSSSEADELDQSPLRVFIQNSSNLYRPVRGHVDTGNLTGFHMISRATMAELGFETYDGEVKTQCIQTVDGSFFPLGTITLKWHVQLNESPEAEVEEAVSVFHVVQGSRLAIDFGSFNVIFSALGGSGLTASDDTGFTDVTGGVLAGVSQQILIKNLVRKARKSPIPLGMPGNMDVGGYPGQQSQPEPDQSIDLVQDGNTVYGRQDSQDKPGMSADFVEHHDTASEGYIPLESNNDSNNPSNSSSVYYKCPHRRCYSRQDQSRKLWSNGKEFRNHLLRTHRHMLRKEISLDPYIYRPSSQPSSVASSDSDQEMPDREDEDDESSGPAQQHHSQSSTSPLAETESGPMFRDDPETRMTLPYKCGVCNRRFSRKNDMERHERGHSSKKPFSCDSCLRGFARRDTLQRHRKSCIKEPEESLEEGGQGQAQKPPVPSGERVLKEQIIRELAQAPRTKKFVLSSLRLKETKIFMDILRIVATPQRHGGTEQWYLRKNYWVGMDVWNMALMPRQRDIIIENATAYYDKVRLPATDPAWDRLLPEHERNKSKSLSRLQGSNSRKAGHEENDNQTSQADKDTPAKQPSSQPISVDGPRETQTAATDQGSHLTTMEALREAESDFDAHLKLVSQHSAETEAKRQTGLTPAERIGRQQDYGIHLMHAEQKQQRVRRLEQKLEQEQRDEEARRNKERIPAEQEGQTRTHDPNVPIRPLAPHTLFIYYASARIAKDLGDDASTVAIQEKGLRQWHGMLPSLTTLWNNLHMYNLLLHDIRIMAYEAGNPDAGNMSEEQVLDYADENSISRLKVFKEKTPPFSNTHPSELSTLDYEAQLLISMEDNPRLVMPEQQREDEDVGSSERPALAVSTQDLPEASQHDIIDSGEASMEITQEEMDVLQQNMQDHEREAREQQMGARAIGPSSMDSSQESNLDRQTQLKILEQQSRNLLQRQRLEKNAVDNEGPVSTKVHPETPEERQQTTIDESEAEPSSPKPARWTLEELRKRSRKIEKDSKGMMTVFPGKVLSHLVASQRAAAEQANRKRLRLLLKELKRGLEEVKQEREASVNGMLSTELSTEAQQDYLMELVLLEKQYEKRITTTKQEFELADQELLRTRRLQDAAEEELMRTRRLQAAAQGHHISDPKIQQEEGALMTRQGIEAAEQVPSSILRSPEAMQDYQMQLKLLEQQNAKRDMMARQATEAAEQAPSSMLRSPVAMQDYQMQLKLLKQQNAKRDLLARQEGDTVLVPPPPQQMTDQEPPGGHQLHPIRARIKYLELGFNQTAIGDAGSKYGSQANIPPEVVEAIKQTSLRKAQAQVQEETEQQQQQRWQQQQQQAQQAQHLHNIQGQQIQQMQRMGQQQQPPLQPQARPLYKTAASDAVMTYGSRETVPPEVIESINQAQPREEAQKQRTRTFDQASYTPNQGRPSIPLPRPRQKPLRPHGGPSVAEERFGVPQGPPNPFARESGPISPELDSLPPGSAPFEPPPFLHSTLYAGPQGPRNPFARQLEQSSSPGLSPVAHTLPLPHVLEHSASRAGPEGPPNPFGRTPLPLPAPTDGSSDGQPPKPPQHPFSSDNPYML